MSGRIRNLIHPTHLDELREWLKGRGWVEVPINANHGYEVLRMTHPEHKGPFIAYTRACVADGSIDAHLTIQGQYRELAFDFIRQRRQQHG